MSETLKQRFLEEIAKMPEIDRNRDYEFYLHLSKLIGDYGHALMKAYDEDLILILRGYAETTKDSPKILEQGLIDDDIMELLSNGCLIFDEKSNAIWITLDGLEKLGLPTPPDEERRRAERFISTILGGIIPDWEKREQVQEPMTQRLPNPSLEELLHTKLSNAGLSVRAFNCLKAADIDTFADLVSYSRPELMKFRHFGRKSLNEIDLLVEKMGLSFGMDVTKYNIEPKKKNV